MIISIEDCWKLHIRDQITNATETAKVFASLAIPIPETLPKYPDQFHDTFRKVHAGTPVNAKLGYDLTFYRR